MSFSLLNDQEQWTGIEGYEGHYAISNMGRVYSHFTNKILKGTKNNLDYILVKLYNDATKKATTFPIHVLVGNAFVGKREGQLTFDHIDRNRGNNCEDNIRLATKSQQQINKNIQSNNNTGYKNITIRANSYITRITRNNKTVFDKHYLMKDFTLEEVVEDRDDFLDNYD